MSKKNLKERKRTYLAGNNSKKNNEMKVANSKKMNKKKRRIYSTTKKSKLIVKIFQVNVNQRQKNPINKISKINSKLNKIKSKKAIYIN